MIFTNSHRRKIRNFENAHLQQRGMLDADELFDDISGDLIDAFANAYVEKAQDKIVSNVLLSEGKFARLSKEIFYKKKKNCVLLLIS